MKSSKHCVKKTDSLQQELSQAATSPVAFQKLEGFRLAVTGQFSCIVYTERNGEEKSKSSVNWTAQ